MDPSDAALSGPSSLACSVIIYRAARSKSWLDAFEAKFNFTAFMLRPNETDLSVDIAALCTEEQASSRIKCHGLTTLHVGHIRDLGLEVIPDPIEGNPAHARIVGVPARDDPNAQYCAAELAAQSRLVWPLRDS